MALVKCPRCELNYMNDTDTYCNVCLRDIQGESRQEDAELCTVCNEYPVMQGKDICLYCYKEMKEGVSLHENRHDEAEDMDAEAEIDEILPNSDDVIPESELSDIEDAISMEVLEDDENKDEEDEYEDTK